MLQGFRRNVRTRAKREGRTSHKEVSEFIRGQKETSKAFKGQWLTKFSKGLDEAAGIEIRCRVPQVSRNMQPDANQQMIIAWTWETCHHCNRLIGRH